VRFKEELYAILDQRGRRHYEQLMAANKLFSIDPPLRHKASNFTFCWSLRMTISNTQVKHLRTILTLFF